ncbi:MAG: GGDEF domain-containing protein, partial [Tepidiformaceae bacterium]
GSYTSLALFDVDRFKLVNDRHGHPAGDAVLRWVAETLAAAIGTCGVVGRLGGEEFGVLFDMPDSLAEQIARSAVECFFTAPFLLEGGVRLPVRVSAGFASCPSLSAGVTQAIAVAYDEADRALYQAKAAGRGRLVAYFKKTAA